MKAAAKRASAAGTSPADRLSALPDELLHAIMSFLWAREAVQTTVLSRRWWNLWRSMPAVNLRSWEFARGSEAWEKMEDFTTNLLMRHNAPILDSFRLEMDFVGPGRCRHADRWIRRAISDNPLVLEVSFSSHRVGEFSSCQFPNLGSGPCRRRLKRLHLRGVSLDRSFAELLPSGCPDLEDLVIESCRGDFCSIQSDKLKNLVLRVFQRERADMLVIKAPRLASLCLDIPNYSYRSGVSLDAGDSLLRASVSLASPPQFTARREAMLLGSLSNVTNLELKQFQAMALLDKEFAKVLTFDSLKTLSLNWCFLSSSDAQKVKALDRFLQKCPNLENLRLKNFWVSSVAGSVEFPILENMRILILDGCDLADDFQLLRCSLQNCPNLEKFTVQRCKFRKVASGEGKAKSEKTHSFRCLKLKYTEIMYQDDDNISELVSFLQGISDCEPKMIYQMPNLYEKVKTL